MKLKVVLIVLLIIVTAALIWCLLPKTYRVDVFANLDPETGVEILTDPPHHHWAVLADKDRLEWACHCDDGLEFRIERIQYLGDLHSLAEFLTSAATAGLQADFDALMAAPMATPEPGEEPEAAPSPHATAQAQIGEALRLLAAIPGGRGDAARPFGDWEPPTDFTAGDRSFRSPPFQAPASGSHLYKFTWVVRPRGETDQTKWAVWDPHFEGHAKPGG